MFQSEDKDPVPPWLQMSAAQAAKRIVKATSRRKRQLTLTLHGKVLLILDRFFPGLVRFALKRSAARKG